MSRQVRRSLILALAGLLGGIGLVLALFGGGDALRRMAGRQEAVRQEAEPPRPETGFRTPAEPGAGPNAPAARTPGTGDTRSAGAARPDGTPGAAGPAPPPPAAGPEAPSFDIVRVEPNGEAVVAGRGAPNTVVEMLVDGRPVARALTDPSGQFAIVPPTLPAGSSAIQLRIRGADGRETRSQQTVAVEVAPGRDRKPLVALTAPDRPTVVLSQPGVPEPGAKTGDNKAADGKTADAKTADAKTAPGRTAPGKTQPARIVSVDAQEGGRLFVTAAGTPGENLRLYLNDTLVAPGRVGPDGRVTFTIGSGVRPGPYRVRVDQIEPGSGKVRARAEVPFSVPEPGRLAAREPAAPAQPGVAEGRGEPAAKPAAPEPRAAAGPAGSGTAGPAPSRGSAEPNATRPGTAAGGPQAPSAPGAPRPGTETAGASPAADGPARAGAVFVPEISTARIIRGDNLWRISQRAYGKGYRYTVIYDANQAQIRDPDLIYPGQIFVLPSDKRG